jgi:hypothetical protein
MPRSLVAGSGLVEQAPDAPASAREEFETRLTVARTSPSDIGQRQVFVRLDDGPRIALVFGDSITLDLEPGSHVMRAHNTLMWRTIPFTVETGEHLEFQLVNRASLLTLTILMWLGSGPLFLKVEKRSLL